MKVKFYRTGEYKKTCTYDNVRRIEAMPEPDEITEDDIEYADGIMLALYLEDDRTIHVPHELIISIEN